MVFIEGAHIYPKHIFENGQCFHWQKLSETAYNVISHKELITVEYINGGISLTPSDQESFDSYWRYYFDLDFPYEKLREEFKHDKLLLDAMDYGWGLRILNQDHFETIISFIVSANNNIKRIQNSIFKISEISGDHIIRDDGIEYFAFPEPHQLAAVSVDELRSVCNLGYRDEYVKRTSEIIASGYFNMDAVENMNLEDARKYLMKLPGVGPKVADCILLFSYNRKECFPVDVWVKRMMETFYIGKQTPKNEIARAGIEYFGLKAGLAQQYLFYFGRDNKLGK